jgi:hypothetical protein
MKTQLLEIIKKEKPPLTAEILNLSIPYSIEPLLKATIL